MKCMKVDELIKQTGSLRDIQILHAQVEGCINGPGLGGDRLRIVCDRVLRACNHQLGAGPLDPERLGRLAALAELALRGYEAAGPQQTPLYVEKILFHLLKNLSAQGAREACGRLGEQLSRRLAAAAESEDLQVLARNCFAVLWKAAGGEGTEKDPSARLSGRMQAVGFLLLLGGGSPPSQPLPESSPPGLVSRHCEAAMVEYEALCSPLGEKAAAILVKESERFLLHPLLHKLGGPRQDQGDPSCLWAGATLCEIVLNVCKQLCKAGCWKRAAALLEQARGRLQGHRDAAHLGLTLELAGRGLGVHQALSAGQECSQHLAECAHALRGFPSAANDQECRMAVEGCQLVAWALETGLKRGQALGGAALLGWLSFAGLYQELLQKRLDSAQVAVRQPEHQFLQQVLFQSLQQGFFLAYDSLLASQLQDREDLRRVVLSCRAAAGRLLGEQQGFSPSDRGEYFVKAVSCINTLACGLYNQQLYSEALSLVEILCKELARPFGLSLPQDKLHRAFLVAVQSSRKSGQPERALDWVVSWLRALGDQVTEHMAEPISLWVRTKADAARSGMEDIRLRTLKDGLGTPAPAEAVLLALLEEELRAYRGVAGDTAQERYNTLCDLLEICHEGSPRAHDRAAYLCELAQVLCYHDLADQTDCSAMDAIQESLRLLEQQPETPENRDRLRDNRAQASLWLYICTLEKNLQEALETDQRLRAAQEQAGENCAGTPSPNDLDYEDQQQDSQLVYEGLRFNLVAESEQSQPLDRALELWRSLLAGGAVPAVRSTKQTASALHLMAALYRLMGKVLPALESYLLAARLSRGLGDSRSSASALCHTAKLLLEIGAPNLAQPHLEEAEACLSAADASTEGLSLLDLLRQLLRSQLCCATGQVEEGVSHLTQVLQELAEQKQTKSWCLLRASALQTVGSFLSLPTSTLPPRLRQRVTAYGWNSPGVALSESRKLLCSVVVTLLGNGVLGTDKLQTKTRFVDQGENLLQKWQVLSEVLSCSQRLVSLSSQAGATCEAKALCLEALRLTTKLQTLRQCAEFLVMKAELELQRGEAEPSGMDLQQVRELLEHCADFSRKTVKKEVKIKPRKGRKVKKQDPAVPPSGQDPVQRQTGEEQEDEARFLSRCPFPREAIDAVREWSLSSSPPLRPRAQGLLSSLAHGSDCDCPCCSDPGLARVVARWAAARAELYRSAEEEGEGDGRKLLLAGLSRCNNLTAKLGAALARLCCRGTQKKPACAPTYLHDLVGRIYLRLACSSLESRAEKPTATWELLEAGLKFLASASSPELEPLRAGLLATKALASICALAAQRDCRPEELFTPAWAWTPPAEGEVQSQPMPVEKAKGKSNVVLAPPKTRKTLHSAKKTPASKKPVVPSFKTPTPGEPYSFDEIDGELPHISIKPASPPALGTPVQTHRPRAGASRGSARPGLKAQQQFKVFVESSPVQDEATPVPAAPRRNKKSRFKVVFSDESDTEAAEEVQEVKQDVLASKKPREKRGAKEPHQDGKAKQLPHTDKPGKKRAGRVPASKTPSTALPPSSPSSEDSVKAVPATRRETRARKGTRSGAALLARRMVDSTGIPEPEQMRTIEEEEEEELLELEMSLEQLRASDTEEQETSGRRQGWHPGLPDGDREVLRRDLGAERDRDGLCEATRGVTPGTSFPSINPEGLSMAAVQALLRATLLSVQHCPPAALYARVCHLLALCHGDALPLATAFLHAESLAITARHSMGRHLYSRQRKLKKASGPDLAERLQELCLGEQPGDPSLERLAHLEHIFQFPCLEPGAFPQGHCQRFQEQLQHIPPGVTVCLLSLASVLPSERGDTVLLSRLERDAPPLTVRVPTSQRRRPIGTLLREFEAMQQEQKALSNVTDKAEWWEGRRLLDGRMKALLESMEEQVLSCWRGLLLPHCQDPEVAKQAACLHQALSECGAQSSEDLLKAVLTAAPLLSPSDLRLLAGGLCPTQPDEAQHLLQSAVTVLKDRQESQPKGHVVLILDKHLQKLPWESVPCLRARAVTRLPSLHFLLGHCALRELDPRSVLNQGVDPRRTFYVLNPQANLLGTEERFRDWFTSEEGWQGVCGRAPTPEQVQEALSTQDLYVYAGHGAGARFLDGSAVLRQDFHAVSLLFGCSSAALAVRGELEGTGIVLNYLMAGCPLVLGNLWDVTDRDIDRFMKTLLQLWLGAGRGAPLLDHMTASRQAPRLKHLIGAAPVVYGLPVSLR
ncbi:separin isoform X2 [Lepisosteus oculatus]|uniref:separin isoform X2 n=1 Tax=Lepisosteus oculatus TaxID=7918 RepID=UPI0035F52C61